MTLDEAIERYTSNAEYERTHGNLQGCLEFKQLADWLKDYKRLLEQNNSDEDCISREEVYKITLDESMELSLEQEHKIRIAVRDLPSVQPMRPKGKWVLKEKGYHDYDLCCSNCGKVIYGLRMSQKEAEDLIESKSEDILKDTISEFCSRCGADMR